MTISSSYPDILQNGTIADATQVMADFYQIQNDVNANAAHNGANSDITSILGLTTALSTSQGGTGQTSLAAFMAAIGAAGLDFITLTSNTTLYVSPSGSDSNNGLTVGTPFLTRQKAVTTAYSYNLNGYTLTIQLADGTYTDNLAVTRPFTNGIVVMNGDSSTPSNVLVTGSTVVQYSARLDLQNFKIQPASGNAISAILDGVINLGVGIIFGSATGASQCYASDNGKIFFNAAYTISGGAAAHFYSVYGGDITTNGVAVTVSGTPTFSGQFAYCQDSNINFASSTFTGSATGQRFNVTSNGVIWDGGAGVSALPGNAAGTWSTGGRYGVSAGAGLINVQYLKSGTTYTPTPGTNTIKYIIVAGGGGGGGSGASGSGGNGGTGGVTSFLSGAVSVAGGTGGAAIQIGGLGGASGTIGLLLLGSQGQSGGNVMSSSGSPNGGDGGTGIYGSGKGMGGAGGSSGATAGIANTGAGGGGGPGNALLANGGGGGGSGAIGIGYATGITGTYTYAIGAGGSAGTVGTSGYAGAVGGSGLIIVEEYS